MMVISLGSVIRATVAAGVVMSCASAPAFALDDGPAPKPKIDCSKAANKNKPACKPSNGPLSDDEIFNLAYWLSRDGHYGEALALLDRAQNKDDPRLLSAAGFMTRKLGNVDGAFPFYAKALAIKLRLRAGARVSRARPTLMKGDLAHATEQLGEIEQRCGQACVAYTTLASQIDGFKASHSVGGKALSAVHGHQVAARLELRCVRTGSSPPGAICKDEDTHGFPVRSSAHWRGFCRRSGAFPSCRRGNGPRIQGRRPHEHGLRRVREGFHGLELLRRARPRPACLTTSFSMPDTGLPEADSTSRRSAISPRPSRRMSAS